MNWHQCQSWNATKYCSLLIIFFNVLYFFCDFIPVSLLFYSLLWNKFDFRDQSRIYTRKCELFLSQCCFQGLLTRLIMATWWIPMSFANLSWSYKIKKKKTVPIWPPFQSNFFLEDATTFSSFKDEFGMIFRCQAPQSREVLAFSRLFADLLNRISPGSCAERLQMFCVLIGPRHIPLVPSCQTRTREKKKKKAHI